MSFRSSTQEIETMVAIETQPTRNVPTEPKHVAIGSVPVYGIEGDSTEEQPYQRVTVGFHFGLVLANLILAGTGIFDGMVNFNVVKILPLIGTIIASIVIGDLGTGVFHWSVDNYGGLKTPLFGSVCAAFQGHHKTPWTITFRKFCNNTYKIAFGTTPWLVLLTAAPAWLVGDYTRVFFALFINWWLVSQELHKYSHMKKTPPNIQRLMDLGIILSKKDHGRHHTPPFDSNYCVRASNA